MCFHQSSTELWSTQNERVGHREQKSAAARCSMSSGCYTYFDANVLDQQGDWRVLRWVVVLLYINSTTLNKWLVSIAFKNTSQIVETLTQLFLNCPDDDLPKLNGMTSLVDRLTLPTRWRIGVRKTAFYSRGLSGIGRISGDSSRLLAARNEGDKELESFTNTSEDDWSIKQANSNTVRGIDLTRIQTRTKRSLLNIDRY